MKKPKDTYMWTCAQCQRSFVRKNQQHSCGDKVLSDFLQHTSAHTIALFWNFIAAYEAIGDITLNHTKSAIALSAKTGIAYIIGLGRNFIDIVFPFEAPHYDNLCFRKIAQVPGTSQFNHHLHLMDTNDINEEVKKFMVLAYHAGCS